jgi:hypothetical protein
MIKTVSDFGIFCMVAVLCIFCIFLYTHYYFYYQYSSFYNSFYGDNQLYNDCLNNNSNIKSILYRMFLCRKFDNTSIFSGLFVILLYFIGIGTILYFTFTLFFIIQNIKINL